MPDQKVCSCLEQFPCILICSLISQASCIAFHLYVFCLCFCIYYLVLYIFLHLSIVSNHFWSALTSRICNHVHVFLFVSWFASKQTHGLQSVWWNCAHVLCCRWFCALRVPANQDASSPSESSVKSAPRWEGFRSKSTLRSLSLNPFLFIS